MISSKRKKLKVLVSKLIDDISPMTKGGPGSGNFGHGGRPGQVGGSSSGGGGGGGGSPSGGKPSKEELQKIRQQKIDKKFKTHLKTAKTALDKIGKRIHDIDEDGSLPDWGTLEELHDGLKYVGDAAIYLDASNENQVVAMISRSAFKNRSRAGNKLHIVQSAQELLGSISLKLKEFEKSTTKTNEHVDRTQSAARSLMIAGRMMRTGITTEELHAMGIPY